jgi:VanZ family protein
MPSFPAPTRILPVVCLVLTVGLLCAGLSPFNPFPKNEVNWLPGGGLGLGKRGIVYGTAPLNAAAATKIGEQTGVECAVQIRVQPKVAFLDNSGTILDLYADANPFQFRLMQWHDVLLIRRDYMDASHQLKTAEMDLNNAFLGDEPATFTIIASPELVVVLRNGQKAGTSSKLGLSCADFAGQLLLGEAPIQDNPWSGKIFDLEFFRKNAPGQVPAGLAVAADAPAANAADSAPESPKTESRIPQPQPTLIGDAHATAHYTFNEGSGKTVRNAIPAGPELHIPYAIVVPHKELLLPPWRELSDKLSIQDIAVNIFGLVPFGFLIFAYFFVQRRWPVGRAAVLTILLGFALSTTIEVLQAYIPSRTSGVLDIIDNTLGTALGVWLFQWRLLQIIGSKLRLFDLPSERLTAK